MYHSKVGTNERNGPEMLFGTAVSPGAAPGKMRREGSHSDASTVHALSTMSGCFATLRA